MTKSEAVNHHVAGLGWVELDFWLHYCLPNCPWADENLAEWAVQVGELRYDMFYKDDIFISKYHPYNSRWAHIDCRNKLWY